MSRRPQSLPIPVAARRALIGGAVLLIVIAAVVNISHTRQHAQDEGQHGLTTWVIGVLPDVMLVLSVTRLRYHLRSLWAWSGVAASVSLVAWAALSTADSGHGFGGQVIALVCLAFAVIATGQAHVPQGEPIAITLAHTEALADDAVRTARLAVEAAGEAERAAQEQTYRALDLERTAVAQADALRAELEAARAASQAPAPAPVVRRTVKRTAGVRKGAQAPVHPDDLQRRREAEAAYKASVRSGAPLDSAAVAAILCGVDEPNSGQRARARARISEWKRAVEAETPEAVAR